MSPAKRLRKIRGRKDLAFQRRLLPVSLSATLAGREGTPRDESPELGVAKSIRSHSDD
jgi:hypothetical protein